MFFIETQLNAVFDIFTEKKTNHSFFFAKEYNTKKELMIIDLNLLNVF